ncbi:MAG: hypothetical protein PHE17_21040 [Thiothrix sp.]|uniref:PKD domain-containing protein n=1 Tax=Thiothrix sp. TaxID=1032 RepID=UPI0026101797|nr:hypothetical protein [Thiothrix sp.]MDD5395517.1 hypothetical protein [Thiothrix sp.]
MRWAFLIVMLLLVPVVSADYTLQFQALTNSPADGATVYVGIQPVAPTATPTGMQVVPTAGTINVVEIYDYSGTAGTNQEYAYYLRVNNATDYLVAKLSVAASERIFTNSSMNVAVAAGDTLILKRVQPAWTTNPLTNIVGGYALIDTPDEVDRGYAIYGMALSNTPADSVINYIGGKPAVPSTTEGQDKIFIPTRGSFTKAFVADYSGTAGTAEAYSYSLDVNSTEYLIESRSVAQSLRMFNNTSMSIPVQIGNYLQFKRQHPAWATNPATNVVGGIAWVDLTDIHDINDGYPIHTFALTHTPADNGVIYYGDRPIAPSTTAGTNKIYIRQAGTIKKAGVYSYSGTAGTGEEWSQYIVKNGVDEYLIANISVADNERMWVNITMNITVVPGDYVELRSNQPTFATNPATTIYGGGFYLEYEDELPVASFTVNETAGTSPLAIQFTNTSVTAPIGWDWFWTCIENSTTYHFSTLENPVETFDNGHFDVRLNVTNASGWSTSAPTRISVSSTGGYSGFTQQDIYLTGFYTLTFNVVDSTTNTPIAVVAISDSTTGQSYTTTNGTGYLTESAGLKYINFVAAGYTSRQITYVVDSDATHMVSLTPTTTTTHQQSTWYTPWQVRIRVVDYYGKPLPLTNVTANYVASTLPSTDPTWLVGAYGVSTEVAADMLNSSMAMTGGTDDNGGLAFTMFKSLQYRLTISNITSGVSSTKTLYPSDQEYVIYVRTTGQGIGNNTLTVRNATLPWYSVNSTHINLNMTYVDTSLCTSNLIFRVWFRDNGTEVHNTTWSGIGAGYVYDNHTVPKAPIGTEYLWGYNATTVC